MRDGGSGFPGGKLSLPRDGAAKPAGTRKKAGIVTFHAVVNYGAVIQAYALAKVVRGLGFDARIIDYRPDTVTAPYLRRGHAVSFTRRLLQYALLMSFIKRHLPLTKRTYRTAADFSRHPAEADFLICGSDQIWNTDIVGGVDPVFFMTLPAAARRIAYAVSMGRTAVPERLRKAFTSAVRGFDAISVREQFAREQLLLCGCSPAIPVVLDPSLLVEDYSEIMPSSGGRRPYIAAYSVIRDDGLAAAAAKLGAILGMPVINISTYRMSGADRNEYLLTPGAWLERIKNASLVCTNSFHGTAMAVLFRKIFYSIALGAPHAGMDNRTGELLSSLGLGERMLGSGGDIPPEREKIMLRPDFDEAFRRLREKREQSWAFLRSSLCLPPAAS